MELARTRTSGDGMENVTTQKENNEIKAFKPSKKDLIEIPKHKNISTTLNENKNTRLSSCSSDKLPIPGLHTIYRAATRISLTPNMPLQNLILYEPKLIKTVNKPEHKKTKPPRFIPFEPYKACISFLTKEEKAKSLVKIKKYNKNNLDINILVSQLNQNEKFVSLEIKEEESMKSEMKKLKEERDSLKRQLKIQVQVNTELKNLLVAAAGEDDLHTKVNILTEDKIELARAYNLSSQTEQIEYLVGQCEVWRSKFLATRIIIEELAQYKNDLNDKNNILCDSNKKMLELINQIREMLIEVLKNIKFLANLRKINLNSADIISLTSECLNITQQMVLHYSGIGIPNTENDLITNTSNVLTEIEKAAYKAIERINPTYLINPDENFKAILKQANRKLSISQDKPETKT